jgi:hypothetical protein
VDTKKPATQPVATNKKPATATNANDKKPATATNANDKKPVVAANGKRSGEQPTAKAIPEADSCRGEGRGDAGAGGR